MSTPNLVGFGLASVFLGCNLGYAYTKYLIQKLTLNNTLLFEEQCSNLKILQKTCGISKWKFFDDNLAILTFISPKKCDIIINNNKKSINVHYDENNNQEIYYYNVDKLKNQEIWDKIADNLQNNN
jgi:hypothetical protein